MDGKLDYQNQLNEKNKPFFDLCDGIFCNYHWKVCIYYYVFLKSYPPFVVLSFFMFFSVLQENYPKDSGTVAGDRRFDVYMGIDVWGRGTYGGGQWNVSSLYSVQPLKR